MSICTELSPYHLPPELLPNIKGSRDLDNIMYTRTLAEIGVKPAWTILYIDCSDSTLYGVKTILHLSHSNHVTSSKPADTT